MDILLLGPLEVVREGARLPLGGASQKALLVLLAQQRQVVPTERLVEDLWGARPPSSAVNIVQTYVYRLRRALGPEAIVARKPGYLLDVADNDVDLTRARRLHSAARDARRSGRPEAAAGAFRAALALFRGAPLADLRDEPALQEIAAMLDELHLATHEGALDAELACGAGAELVEELTRLTREQPLRENLHGQLMLALARAGRQAEALAAYRRLATTLATELGVDPCPALRELEARILRQEPALLSPPPRRPATVRTGTALPAPMTVVVGRARELSDVATLVGAPGARLVTLTGPGGVGKTRLAIETLRRVAADAPAPEVAWVDVSSVGQVPEVLPAIARGLGILSFDEEDAVGRLADALAGRAVLLALDNLEQVVEVGPTIVDLLGRAPQLRVLVTSRRPLGVYGEWLYRVPTLPLDDAVRLLVERARSHVHGWAPKAADAEPLAEICRSVDLLPLAIELVALRLRHEHPVPLAASLSRTPDRALPALPGDAPPGPLGTPARHRSLRGALQWSVDLLDAPEREAFGRLAAFAGDFDAEAASAVCGLTDATSLVRSLSDHSLLQPVTPNPVRVRMLRVVQDFARQQLTPDGWAAARDAHAAYVVDLAAAQRPPHPTSWPDPDQAAALDAHADEFSRALSWLRDRGQGGHVALAASLWPYWHLRGRIRFASRWLGQARTDVGIEPVVRGHALLGLAWLSLARNDPDAMEEAAQQAIGVFRALDDRMGLAAALSTRATSRAMSNDTAGARRLFMAAVDASRTAGDHVTLVHSLINWSDVELGSGHPEEAQRLLRQAIVVPDRKAGVVLAAILVNLGFAKHDSGDDVAAMSHFRDALAAAPAQPHPGFHPAVMVGLAAVAASRRRLELATTLCAAARVLTLTSDEQLQPYLGKTYDLTRAAARAALAGDVYECAWRSGLEMAPADSFALALRPDLLS